MIFFTDKNNPTYKGIGKFKEETQALLDTPDDVRLEYTNKFLGEYRKEYGENPADVLLERIGNFILRPYIGKKDQDYPILSVYSLERRQANESSYIDDMNY